MTVSTRVEAALNRLLRLRGREIVRTALVYDWQRNLISERRYNPTYVSPDARERLRPDHPFLLDLERRYKEVSTAASVPSVWREGHVRPEDLIYFRGDNAWVWQVRGRNLNELSYALTYFYLRAHDREDLLDRLTEDETFGNFTFVFEQKRVSRDLLDSISELYFLERHLCLFSRKGLRLMDIGAGYGRLAHRATAALSGLEKYVCTDAIAVSTFVSDYYLRFRGAYPKAEAIPLDQIESVIKKYQPEVAINIHSFSECRVEAIGWWIDLLACHGVRYLFIAPNATNCGGEKLQTNDLREFSSILTEHGYQEIVKEPKYADPVVQQHGISPTWYFLFELKQ